MCFWHRHCSLTCENFFFFFFFFWWTGKEMEQLGFLHGRISREGLLDILGGFISTPIWKEREYLSCIRALGPHHKQTKTITSEEWCWTCYPTPSQPQEYQSSQHKFKLPALWRRTLAPGSSVFLPRISLYFLAPTNEADRCFKFFKMCFVFAYHLPLSSF